MRPFPNNPYAAAWTENGFPDGLDDDEFVAYVWSTITHPPNIVGYLSVPRYLPNAVMMLHEQATEVEMTMTVNANWCYMK